MSRQSLNLTLRLTRLGWCLFVNGVAYAIGSRDYCVSVANAMRKGGAA